MRNCKMGEDKRNLRTYNAQLVNFLILLNELLRKKM